MVFVAGLAVAAFTSHGGEARADDHQLELVSIEAEGGKTQSSVDQSDATHVASTALDEPDPEGQDEEQLLQSLQVTQRAGGFLRPH